MIHVRGLSEDDIVFDCSHYKKAKGTCRAGAPHEGVNKGESCPFDYGDQHLCSNYTH